MSSNKLVPLTVNDLVVREGAHYISHHVLAERLGVRAADLMRVIKLLCEEDVSFGAFEKLCRSAELVGATNQRREHILLDEKQAITVTLESRSKRRHELRNEIVNVYLAVKNGPQPGDGGVYEAIEARILARVAESLPALVTAAVAPALAMIVPRVSDMERRQQKTERDLLLAESRRNRITHSGRSKISLLLDGIADRNARANRTSQRAERTRAQNRLTAFIGWTGACRSFDNIPGHLEGLAVAHLEEEFRRAAKAADAAEQTYLDGYEDDDYLASLLRGKRRA